MRFWNSKVSTDKEKSWSVILNPLRSELDRKRVAEKISELFQLSFEEARTLTQSTPIILLDELSHPVAQQVQNIFQQIRADITLTNEALVKRRCYRAVWPEFPSLSFLNERTETVSQEKVIEEIPFKTSVQTMPSPAPVEIHEEKISEVTSDLEKKYRELELLLEEKTRVNEELKQNLAREIQNRSGQDSSELKTSIGEWEEKYHNIRDEYQEAKKIYEEKILTREREFKAVKEQIRSLQVWHEKAAELERRNKEILERLSQLEASKQNSDRTLKERHEELNQWREKYHTLAQKSERFESLYEEERKRREQIEEASRQTSDLATRSRQEIELQTLEAERWKKKVHELEESQKRLEEEFSQFSEGQGAEMKRLREANQSLEMQLEVAQRTSRDLLSRLEQQELIEKRARFANELSSKEARLREVVLEAERLRQELQDRELRVQTLVSEQANLEREILEIKQAQRHLLEQSKLKEKGSRFKKPTKNSDLAEAG
ncbi:MAG: hypothetical protein HY447_05410 [Candidatus Omnitrophica bacterium]|nr:hypothetical protein [Candidatus Omnitrophota bacterium]